MFHKNLNELAYPFLYDPVDSLRCDFEILSDELCSWCGLIAAHLPSGEMKDELNALMGNIYDLNGSLRGQMAIAESDIAALNAKCDEYSAYSVNAGAKFVLPAGHPAACCAHIARTRAKALVRLLYREHQRTDGGVDEALIRYANLLSNYFFLASLKINAENNVPEMPFTTKSYGVGGSEE